MKTSLTNTERRYINYFSVVLSVFWFINNFLFKQLKVVISQGFICPLCMKRCITAIDLSEHYQQVHTENETRGQELLNDSSVTVGPVYFALAAWLWVAQIALFFLALVLLTFLCYKGNMGCFNYVCMLKRRFNKENRLLGSWVGCSYSLQLSFYESVNKYKSLS